MKNSTYNTGRTVTINLDTLGNAALWQIFQILTDGTGDTFYGNEEEASPAADPDAACEIFLHAAETANDRAAGADAAQRAWLQEMVAEYTEIFETNPADDLRKRLDITYNSGAAPAEEERDAYTLPADDARAEQIEQIITRAGLDVSLICNTNAGGYTHNVTLLGDADDIETLLEEITREIGPDDDANEEEPTADGAGDIYDRLVAAWRADANEDLDAALEANARDTNNDPNNLYRAGVFAGLAEAAAWMIYSRGTCPDDINAINAAIYKAYGVAW